VSGGEESGRRRREAIARDDLVLLAARRRQLRRRRRGGVGKRWLLGGFLAFLVVLGAGLGAAALKGSAILSSRCSLSRLKPLSLSQNSFVYTADGRRIGVIPSVRNRRRIGLAQMSRWVPRATVAIEDRRFYRHGALDYLGIARAALKDAETLSFDQGGSTITQQLVRTLYLGRTRTVSRKLEEACLAIRLERNWTKRRILTAYLNDVYYGSHAFGVEAAAETFFSVHASDLDVQQAALLAGLPRAPSTFDPLQRPGLALQRRNQVLAAMRATRVISRRAYRRAVRSPLGLRPGRLYRAKLSPAFSYVLDELDTELGPDVLGQGGLRIRTTIDSHVQHDAIAALESVLKQRADPAGALVAIDPGTGAVRAMVSYLPSGEHLQFNLAAQARRQAGSAFKPFVLATALEQGLSPYSYWNGPPELVIPDPRCFTNGKPWDVHNYADESAGTMNLLDAIAYSVNTIFAQVSVKVGPANVVALAHRLGITSPLQPVCSITLGTQGVSPLEMADAYATLASRGVHHAPEAIQRVSVLSSHQLLQSLRWNGQRVLPQPIADEVTYALEGVVQHGTGTAASFGRPAAGKTGTAENYQDAWFCGYVPQLATCVWVGYPHREQALLNVEGVPAVFGGSLPAEIWRGFMSAALAGAPVRDFARPSSTGDGG
jgi:penicillin-binding protein 1A